jgi:transcriptional regulator with XRE-family HTH domain
MHMFHVGDVVWKLRGLRKWTLQDLADHSGVNKMTISGIEQGGNHMRAKLDAVARALDVGDDASGLDERLHTWCAKIVGPRGVSTLSDGAREWLKLYEALALDPKDLEVMVALVRRHAHAVRRTRLPKRKGSRDIRPAAPHQRTPARRATAHTGRR